MPVASRPATVLLIVGAAYLSSACSKHDAVQASSTKAAELPTVAVAKASTEDLSHGLVLTAEFKPYQEVDVMAKVAGYIKKINVDVGDRVHQGQLLAILEIPEMGDDLTRADAATVRARAEVARARDELHRAETAHNIAHLSFQRLSAVAEKKPGPGRPAGDRRGPEQGSGQRSPGCLREIRVGGHGGTGKGELRGYQPGQDDAGVHARHRPVCRGGYPPVRRHRIDDSGGDRVPNSGDAGDKALRQQHVASDPAGARIGRADRAHRPAGRSPGADPQSLLRRAAWRDSRANLPEPRARWTPKSMSRIRTWS